MLVFRLSVWRLIWGLLNGSSLSILKILDTRLESSSSDFELLLLVKMIFVGLASIVLILTFLLVSYLITVVLNQHDIDCFPMSRLHGLVLNVGILKRFSNEHKKYRGLYYFTVVIIGLIAADFIVIATKVVFDSL